MFLSRLHRINFALLLALGGLCAFQWEAEKSARSRIDSLLRAREELTRQHTEQTVSLNSATEDLDAFRKQIISLKAQSDEQGVRLRDQNSQIARLETDGATLTKQLGVWKQAVDDHRAALEARDVQIADLIKQRDGFYAANKASIERANSSVAALNDLNEKHSDIVARYNELAAQAAAQAPTAKPAEPPPGL